MIDFSLIDPPIQLKTLDERITVASNKDEMTINLIGLQPRLYKRLTKKRKTEHMSSILLDTVNIFDIKNFDSPLINDIQISLPYTEQDDSVDQALTKPLDSNNS